MNLTDGVTFKVYPCIVVDVALIVFIRDKLIR